MKKEKIQFTEGLAVKISKKSRALLTRAFKDGLTDVYSTTVHYPNEDCDWKYFKFFNNEWCRSDSYDTLIDVKELENMLYPKPEITFSDTLKDLINKEITRVGIENVTPLELALLKTVGLYPPQEIKVYEGDEHVATVTKDKVILSEGEYSADLIYKLKAAHTKLNSK
jgi:hypothetical protein